MNPQEDSILGAFENSTYYFCYKVFTALKINSLTLRMHETENFILHTCFAYGKISLF